MMKSKKIFILGMARSGYAAAKLLAKDNQVIITDQKEQEASLVEELKNMGVEVVITQDPCSLLNETYDYMIKNPGIKYNHPAVEKARELNIKVINEMEVAYFYLNKKAKVIGITGSNGKTTTTTLIYNMLKKEHNNTFLGGNIGIPFSQFVLEVKEGDYVVLEISDHQLCDMDEFKTNISVLTNIYPVHLDFHDSFERYKKTKKKIFAHHTSTELAIINQDNEEAMNLTRDIPSKKEFFSKGKKTDAYLKDNAIYYRDEKVIECKEILLQGEHNYENIMAAILAVKECGVSNRTIKSVLKTFKGVEHRLEYVTTINKVEYYNDSKATNTESTKIALKSFEKDTYLLLGGLDRGHSFEDLTPCMNHVVYVACYGETKNRIKEYCSKLNIVCEVFETLKEATQSCMEKARENSVVLLSPACASWDQYACFEDRGDEFKRVVLEGKHHEL
ncbi:MAG: UDP-N-acetylmuramoyl-L-alanine--D-glutamate ligase [Bacilli bacterium]|nr:UDP-N-acetylmuramoyl-L-alanine--D-glutamate ligase [Bacilli bacterium]